MAITSIARDYGIGVCIVRIVSTDTLATVAGAGYITDQNDNITALNNGEWEWVVGDLVLVAASDGDQFFQFAGDDFTTLIQLPGGNGEVALPVVDGDFVVFDGTLGGLKDAGYAPSDPAQTIVVMQDGAAVIGDVPQYSDITGTIEDSGVALADLVTNTLTSGHILVGNAGNVATDVAMSGDVAISNAGVTTIQAGSIDLAMLSAGITPSHVVKFAAKYTTSGGAAAEAITVTGAAATDLAFVQLVDNGTNNVTVSIAVMTLNTLTVTFSGDPGADTIIYYQILRAAS